MPASKMTLLPLSEVHLAIAFNRLFLWSPARGRSIIVVVIIFMGNLGGRSQGMGSALRLGRRLLAMGDRPGMESSRSPAFLLQLIVHGPITLKSAGSGRPQWAQVSLLLPCSALHKA